MKHNEMKRRIDTLERLLAEVLINLAWGNPALSKWLKVLSEDKPSAAKAVRDMLD